ncbi:Protein wntless [Sarcoptes scabiei]|uniref:Protein wntless n=1 Tax=Sarcoptes scabiei TaxID=52283 RepID=A0A834R2M9_SARSC|nr:Protein wntless [Sarcoptes scabiei]
MPGTILENLSNRKLLIVLSIICFIQIVSFLIGAFITPAPSSPEQYIAIQCVPERPEQFSAPRDIGSSRNCRAPESHDQHNITFAFQMPLPRGGVQLDYSRWMQNLLTLIIPEVLYDERLSDSDPPGDQHINASIIMNVRLGVKNIGDTEWKEYYKRDRLKRTITCHIEGHKRKQGINYECDLIQLFELQSLYYDFYLINLQLISNEKSQHFGFLNNLSLVAIHQNGGFTKIWLSLKSVFFVITLLTLIWYLNRINQLPRDTNLLEKCLILLGFGITQYNIPVEFLSLFIDVEFMSFLCDIRQGIFHCSLLIFWIVFIGEHLMDDVNRVGLSSYYKQLIIILVAYISLFVFESSERGIQVIDPFYSIWEVDSNFAMIFITITVLGAISYFFFLTYHLWLAFRNISTKQLILPSMPTARRLIYQGVIFRFKFLLLGTFICATCTIIAYIMGQISEDQWYWDDQRSFLSSLQWSSAMFTTVFALWNCYVMTLLILYAPSHKGVDSNTNEMSVEFTRLTDYDLNDCQARINYQSGNRTKKPPTCEMSLLQDLATKHSIS